MFNTCDMACLIAVGLFAAQLFIMVGYKKKDLIIKFESLLNDEQKLRYRKIVNERLTIYIHGLILGIILGFIYLSLVKESTTARACVFTVIVLGVNMLYYILKPKSDYMVPHLKTQDQRIAWLDIYKEMQFRCKLGFVIGIAAFLLFGLFIKI